ncbi:MAG: 8-amino-7-oxononanoate synthase [Mariprofundaceae bacterium]
MSLPSHDSRVWFSSTPTHRKRSLLHSQQQGCHIQLGTQQLINFSSNDYLGLRNHPKVITAAMQSIKSNGLGSGASRLIGGDAPEFHQLESALADWKAYEACLLVGSGMLANLGLIQALADRHTLIFSDKLNHASLVDGVRLSAGKSYRFPHGDYHALAEQLAKHPAEKRIIISDGVFSMDGDCANVEQLLGLAEQHDCLLVIDDAHGTACIGPQNRGLCANIAGHPRLIEVGTFGKAFGGYGAFILASNELIEGLKQRMRTMIYSTAMPVAMPAAMLTALECIKKGDMQQKLQQNIALFQQQTTGLNLLKSDTPIQALIIGQDSDTLIAAEKLRQQGMFVPAIRPPTVPEGTARLRITLSACHSTQHIEKLTKALKGLA